MKTLSLLVIFMLSLTTVSAQSDTHISFEAAEGYTLDTINGQNGWLTNPTFSSLFRVSDEQASDGSYALKGRIDTTHSIPQNGVIPALSPVYSNISTDSLALAMDLYIGQPVAGSPDDFEIIVFGQQEANQVLITGRVVFSQGHIAIEITDPNNPNGFAYQVAGTFDYDSFFNFRMVFLFNEDEITYYVNGDKIFTGDVFSGTTLTRYGFFTNGNLPFYVDNIDVDEAPVLGLSRQHKIKFQEYVNKGRLYLTSPDKLLKTISLFDLSGREVRHQKLSGTHGQVDLYDLAPGVYIVNVILEKGVKKFTIRVAK